jgi:hypothetical protein
MSSTPHPLEDVFNIQAGSTPLATASASVSNEMLDPATGEIVERKTEGVTDSEIAKEERIEDLKIDGQIDVIHSAAITAFEAQHRLSQEVDPKFSARNAEVAAQYLKIALDAVGTRVDTKFKRAKIRSEANTGPRQVQNNLIVADRNDLLKNLFDSRNNGDIINPTKE